MITLRAGAILTNTGWGTAPFGTFTLGEGRGGELRSSTQQPTRSPGQEQLNSHCPKRNKAQHHLVRQSKPGILAWIGRLRVVITVIFKNIHCSSSKPPILLSKAENETIIKYSFPEITGTRFEDGIRGRTLSNPARALAHLTDWWRTIVMVTGSAKTREQWELDAKYSMAANDCYLEDLEPEAMELPSVGRRKQGVPYPSSVYGRSVAEKYFSSDRNPTPVRDSPDFFGSHTEQTTGRLRASPASTHLAIPGLRQRSLGDIWRDFDPLVEDSDAIGFDGTGRDDHLDFECSDFLAQDGEDLVEKVGSVGPEVSSAFRAISKRFSVRRNSRQNVGKQKADNQRTPPKPVKPVEARRPPSSSPTYDLESSVIVEGLEHDRNACRHGVEDLSKYLVAPGQKIPLQVVPPEQVHPFAVPEDLPLEFDTRYHNTILNDELDMKYDRIWVIIRWSTPRRYAFLPCGHLDFE